MDDNWQRVGAAIERKRGLLYNSQGEAAKAARVGVSVWQQLERAEKNGYKRATLARVEAALNWPLGSIEIIAGGGPLPDEEVSDLRTRIGAVEEKVEQILERLGDE